MDGHVDGRLSPPHGPLAPNPLAGCLAHEQESNAPESEAAIVATTYCWLGESEVVVAEPIDL